MVQLYAVLYVRNLDKIKWFPREKQSKSTTPFVLAYHKHFKSFTNLDFKHIFVIEKKFCSVHALQLLVDAILTLWFVHQKKNFVWTVQQMRDRSVPRLEVSVEILQMYSLV